MTAAQENFRQHKIIIRIEWTRDNKHMYIVACIYVYVWETLFDNYVSGNNINMESGIVVYV